MFKGKIYHHAKVGRGGYERGSGHVPTPRNLTSFCSPAPDFCLQPHLRNHLMIIRWKPIKKSNKWEYIIIEAPGPDDFQLRVTEKDKDVQLLRGTGTKSQFVARRRVIGVTRLCFISHQMNCELTNDLLGSLTSLKAAFTRFLWPSASMTRLYTCYSSLKYPVTFVNAVLGGTVVEWFPLCSLRGRSLPRDAQPGPSLPVGASVSVTDTDRNAWKPPNAKLWKLQSDVLREWCPNYVNDKRKCRR